MTTTMIEQTKGHYEVREAPYGTDYAWYPPSMVLECDCGERITLTASTTMCRCGADHAALIEEELASRRRLEEASRPLDRECREWRNKQDEYLRSEKDYQQELSAID